MPHSYVSVRQFKYIYIPKQRCSINSCKNSTRSLYTLITQRPSNHPSHVLFCFFFCSKRIQDRIAFCIQYVFLVSFNLEYFLSFSWLLWPQNFSTKQIFCRISLVCIYRVLPTIRFRLCIVGQIITNDNCISFYQLTASVYLTHHWLLKGVSARFLHCKVTCFPSPLPV